MSETLARSQLARLSSMVAVFAFVSIVVAGFNLSVNGSATWSSLSAPTGTISLVHLAVAIATALTTLAFVAHAALRAQHDRRVLFSAIVAMVLIVTQTGAVTVLTDAVNVEWRSAIHFGATALLLATALYVAHTSMTNHSNGVAYRRAANTPGIRLRWVLAAATLTIFGVLVSGAYLTALPASTTCDGWPLCSGMSSPMLAVTDPHIVHRLLVGIAGVLLVITALAFVRARNSVIVSTALLFVFAIEAIVGAFSAGGVDTPIISGIHFGAAGAAWGLLVFLGLTATSAPFTAPRRSASALRLPASARSAAGDYLRVTKPGIMLLLLITTLGAMLVAPGWPSIWLIAATLLGGALASGGASALNCYLDRDIDMVMARTRKRPIPTGTLTPVQVRNFGLLLSALAVVELWVLVNPVAALLALGGNLFYVLIYTGWLKRTTPQNIVIGGAAGAFPPLVGWAAVTGTVSITSILLFAIIFYWTPPHFWSLALLKARDYERAGIPMLPVTHGDQQTRKFILMYALLLVAITLLVVPAGAAGAVYLICAVFLGAIFVTYAARMYLEGTSRLAWRLFKYSNYYLALLLLAMVVDRAL